MVRKNSGKAREILRKNWERMGKLKAKWVKTDIPRDIKVKYHWKAMVGRTTYQAWQQAMASMTWGETDRKWYRDSRDTYKSLKDEIREMPSHEIEALPPDIKSWVSDIRQLECGLTATHTGYLGLSTEEKARGIAHDTELFNESDAILGESDVRNIYIGLSAGNELLWDVQIKLQKFMWFFDYEGNKYVSRIIREKCEEFISSADELGKFVGQYFYPSEDREPKSELWIPSHIRYKFEWPEETWEEYHKLEPELHRLANMMLEAYKSYRAAVRDIIIV
jgi:hypothetical protein